MNEQKSNLIEKKLLQYSAAAAAVILMAGSADAQIWNSGEIDKTMADSDTARITYEGTHYLIMLNTLGAGQLVRFGTNPGSWLITAGSIVKMLNQGDVVQPGTFSFASSLTNAFVTSNGSFGNGIDKYIGINAGSHYGWIKVNVPATPHPTWVLKGYAINTQLATQITCDGVLPVELTSFTVELLGTSASLLWNTATEVNNYGFDIERNFLPEDLGSAPSVTEWEKIGFVPGNGNSNSPKAYSFIDPAPPAGLVMYRLKQIDNDGASDYSQIVTVAVAAPKEFVLEQNFPNPFNPVTEIKYSIPEAGFVTLIVYDMLGKEAASLVNGKEGQGSHSVRFDASNLPSGTYMYRLTVGSFTETKKLMLLK